MKFIGMFVFYQNYFISILYLENSLYEYARKRIKYERREQTTEPTTEVALSTNLLFHDKYLLYYGHANRIIGI